MGVPSGRFFGDFLIGEKVTRGGGAERPPYGGRGGQRPPLGERGAKSDDLLPRGASPSQKGKGPTAAATGPRKRERVKKGGADAPPF